MAASNIGAVQSSAATSIGAVQGAAPPPVIVCTDGVWSVPVSFAACDDFRVTIDGPAANDIKVSATLEFEEP